MSSSTTRKTTPQSRSSPSSKTTPQSRSSPDNTSSSSILIRNEFKRLYKKYEEYCEKVKIATKKDIPKTLLLKNAYKKFMVESQTLKTTINNTIKNVLYPPNYDKISTLTLKRDDDRFDLSKKYVTLHEDTEQLPIINVTNDFLLWFDEKIDELIKIVNKKNKQDILSELPSEIISKISKKLSPDTRPILRRISTTMQETLPREKIPYYHRTNHPNFIKAFQKALFEYKTIKSEEEIFKEYKVDFDKYKEIQRLKAKYRYKKGDNNVFHKVICMYFKLLNVSNMNPKYIDDLVNLYGDKMIHFNYLRYVNDIIPNVPVVSKGVRTRNMAGTTKIQAQRELEIKSRKNIDIIIKYELLNIKALMYLCSSNKPPFVERDIWFFGDIMDIVLNGLNDDSTYTIRYIAPYISKEIVCECYSYIYDTIRLDSTDLHPESELEIENFFKTRKEHPLSSPNDTLITIPREITSMKALRKHPIGMKNYENCLQYIMTNTASITNYTDEGKKLNFLYGFGL